MPLARDRSTPKPALLRFAMPALSVAAVAVKAPVTVAFAVAPPETTSPSPPERSVTLSTPASTLKMSLPAPPVRVSLPAPPVRVSAPTPPERTLAPELPLRALSRVLPVPLMLAVPNNVRFSTLAARAVIETVLSILSIPSLRRSVTTSPLAFTT